MPPGTDLAARAARVAWAGFALAIVAGAVATIKYLLWQLGARRRVVAGYAADLRALGPANFLYADGDALFAHGHKRIHPGKGIRPPGLHLLCRGCDALSAPGLRIAPTVAGGSEVLLASVPLSDDRGWRALREGEWVVVHRGHALEPLP